MGQLQTVRGFNSWKSFKHIVHWCHLLCILSCAGFTIHEYRVGYFNFTSVRPHHGARWSR